MRVWKGVVAAAAAASAMGLGYDVVNVKAANLKQPPTLKDVENKALQDFNELAQKGPTISHTRDVRLAASIQRSIDHCDKIQRKLGLPGLSVAVSVNGKSVFRQGFGYADVENSISMTPESVLRIASISKSITMAMLAAQLEEGKVNIDLPIQTYLPDFPKKKWEGSEVTITTRHLLSHLSGIRHYKTKQEIEAKKEGGAETDSDYHEFYCKDGCESVTKAMERFQNDDLIHKPGTQYFYTTHGWTVVSAVIEKIAGTSFEKHAKRMFHFWGLHSTFLDEHNPIIKNRARSYHRDKEGKLVNSPWVDNSCKWAGGGFLSTVDDLLKFAHIMLHSAQQPESQTNGTKPFLKRETIQKLWTGDKATAVPFGETLYGLGWVVGDPFSNCVGCNSREDKFVAHSGGAVGCTSILLIQLPPEAQGEKNCIVPQKEGSGEGQVKGVVVAMITNLEDAGLSATAKKLVKEFEWMMTDS